MKKLFTLLILLGGVVLAQAQSLKIGGTSISLSGSSTITVSSSAIKSGTVKYNQSAKVLYLDNATIEYDGDCITANVEGLIIDFKGTNKITSTSSKSNCAGIYIWGEDVNKTVSLRSNNNFDPASVTINNNGTGGSIITQGNRLNIFALNLSCKANQNHCIYVNTSSSAKAIFGPMYSKISLTAASGKAAVYGFTGGLYSYRDNINTIAWTDKSLKFSKDSGKGGFVNSGGNLVSSISIQPVLSIGKAFIDPSDFTFSTSNASALGLTDGTIKFTNSTKTLTFNGAKISIAAQVLTSYLPGLNIEATGASTLTSTGNYGMSLYANTNFTGSGTLNVEATHSSFSGIKVFNSSDVTIKMKKIYVKGKCYGWSGSDGGTLTLSNNSSSDYYFEGTGNGALNAKNLVLEGMDYFYNTSYGTPGCYFDDGFVRQNGGNIVKGSNVVNFYKLDESDKYNIFVAGTQVTDNNRLAVGSKYITSGGSTAVTYDASTKTLKLNGVTIKLTESAIAPENCGIYHKYKDFIIETSGTNNITTAYEALQLGGNTTIKGNGTFNVTSTESHAIEMLNDGGLTLMRSGGVMAATGAKYGYYGYQSTNLTIQKDGSNGGLYKFVGAEGNIHNTLVKFGEGVGLHTRYTWYNKDKFCYYNRYSEAKGTTLDQGTWIRCDLPLQKYGVFVGGDEITGFIVDGQLKGPAWGFCNKYYQGDGISYDPSSKTLTLNGVTLDVGSDYVNGIKNTADGLTIKVTGTNVLTSSHSGYNSDNVPIKVSANTTITGDGSLKVEKLPVSTYSNANLTLKDAKNLEFYGIKANTSSSTSKLLVDNSNVTINGSTNYFANVSWQNGFLHLPKDGYFDSEIRKIVDSYGNAATKVVFGDKTTAGIDGITTDADAEVIGIYDAQGRKLEEMQQGINIIRMSDGTTKKVIRK